jgi:uncharacterized protein YcfJ
MTMKKLLLLVATLLSCLPVLAQEVGQVISSMPVIQQVVVPRQVCSTDHGAVQPQPRSGAGAVLGAIAGGAMGNAIGDGSGRAAATIIGLIGGAILGDRVEGGPPYGAQGTQHCTVQNFYENRTVAYNVVYEYAGKQYSVQLPYDPGPTIRLQVTPLGAGQSPLPPAGTSQGPAWLGEPADTIVATPVYPRYALRPYYPPITLHLGFGYWGGHRHHHRWR